MTQAKASLSNRCSAAFCVSFQYSVTAVSCRFQLQGGMNSVSPTATQYVTGGMQDELVENRRQQPLEHQGSFGPRLPQPTDAGREVTGEPDEMDKLKAKLMSAWNNVKYGLSLSLLGWCLSAEWYLLTFSTLLLKVGR